MSRKYSIAGSFRFALSGLSEALWNEPNFQIHTIVAITALIAAKLLNFAQLEWIILAFTIAFVLILELFNTAIEKIVDMVSPEIQESAKVAKDVSAAAVFISAILSIAIGLVLFLPKVLGLINQL